VHLATYLRKINIPHTWKECSCVGDVVKL